MQIEQRKWGRSGNKASIHEYLEVLTVHMSYCLCLHIQFGETALMWASNEGHEQVLDSLLKAGATLDIAREVYIMLHFGWFVYSLRLLVVLVIAFLVRQRGPHDHISSLGQSPGLYARPQIFSGETGGWVTQLGQGKFVGANIVQGQKAN